MKSRQKITRVQLEVDSKEDYMLVGIVSVEPDYRLSLSLNKYLKTSLRNASPVEIRTETGTEMHFSRFSDTSRAPEITISLISNKSGKSCLLRKLDKIDYFLQVHSDSSDFNLEKITGQLRNIETVTGVFSLQPGDIKDKNLQYLIP